MARTATATLVAVAWLHAWGYRRFLSDDALISARYARRFARGEGLTWTDGEWVEGYSDLLWVLGMALFEAVGAGAVVGARVMGGLGFALCVLALSTDPGTLRLHPARALTGGLMAAVLPPLAIWSMGGLEHTLLAGVVLAATTLLLHDLERGRTGARWGAAALLGAATLLRADGAVLVAGSAAGALLFAPRRAVRVLPVVVGLPAAAWLAQLGFRWWAYHDWVPNTARVKVSGSWERTRFGTTWLARGLLHNAPLVLLSAAGAAVARSTGPRVGIPLTTAGVWMAYVAWVGGDIFAGWRQLVPGLALLAMPIAEAGARVRWTPSRSGVALTVVAAWFIGATFDPRNRCALDETWARETESLAVLVHRLFPEHRPLIAVDAAGALPYYADTPSLDMLGLTDAWLPRHPPKQFGRLGIGHDLGNANYVQGREPDLIVFNSSFGTDRPRWLAGRRLLWEPTFLREYSLVWLRAPGPHDRVATWYARREGPQGVRRTAHGVHVPGWLFRGAEVAAREGAGGLMAAQRPASLSQLSLPRGRWTVRTLPSGPVGVSCGGTEIVGVGPVIEQVRTGRIDLVLPPDPAGSVVTGVLLTRDPRHGPSDLRCGEDSTELSEVVLPGTPGVATVPVHGTLDVQLTRPRRLTGATLHVAGTRRWSVQWLRRGQVVRRTGTAPQADPTHRWAPAPDRWVDGLRLVAEGGQLLGLTLSPIESGDGPPP